MTLCNATAGNRYTVSNINTDDEELNSFLFTLGCFEGEQIEVLSKKKRGLVVGIKDGKYSIDNFLADAIEV